WVAMQYYLHVVLPGVSKAIRLHGDAKSTATTDMTLSCCYKPKLDVELDHN
uniref:Uncharacterized protein n=1 Tax=Amphimedon queenslandica TaxID=400682 RepID=A0A1X7TC06_AMPQE